MSGLKPALLSQSSFCHFKDYMRYLESILQWIHKGPIPNDAIKQAVSMAYQNKLNRIKLVNSVQL